jgi:hypothetical protein
MSIVELQMPGNVAAHVIVFTQVQDEIFYTKFGA